MSSYQPSRYDPEFEPVEMSLLDLTFVKGITINPGPSVAAYNALIPNFMKKDADPLVIVTVQGVQLEQHGDHVHPASGMVPMVATWAEVADCAASIAGMVETWPEDVRTRYIGRYDQSVVAWREAWKEAKP